MPRRRLRKLNFGLGTAAVLIAVAVLIGQGLRQSEEGNLAMLILRTADNLRHIRNLSHVFPDAAECAAEGVEAIMRDPVITDL